MPPLNLPSDQVRQQFIDFFVKLPRHAHTFVPSSPAVPHDDPTLLFANAGMNQFKPLFLGRAEPGSPLFGLKRAVNSQKCIRAGGKHNDLDDVGKDTYHHTFFEMLGNWSFGDYFKIESLAWGVELLTRVLGLDPSRLYATYFGGNKDAGLEPDIEARDIWLSFLPKGHVLPGSMKDNFWEMGDTGPCGPCSEIHYDRIGGRDASALVNTGDPNVLEIWNHVFIQYDRQAPDRLASLPAKHVDTGMGFERLVSVLQDKKSNYDTDVFAPYFEKLRKLTGARPYAGRLGAADSDSVDTGYRVIADHIRTLTFAITDGAVPSNDGRGYVLRRILRRAVRFGRQKMDAKTGFLAELVPSVVATMGAAFPELKKQPQRVADIIREEEESFGRTLDRGIVLFDKVASLSGFGAYINAINDQNTAYVGWYQQECRKAGLGGSQPEKFTISTDALPVLDCRSAPHARGLEVNGKEAFMLYDTYGFPIDLTQQMAEERGLSVDVAGFEACMAEQRERSRAGAKGCDDKLTLPADAIDKLKQQGVPTTDDSRKHSPAKECRARVRAIWSGQALVQMVEGDKLAGGEHVGIILDKTNVYAEAGGQVADHAEIYVEQAASSSGPKPEFEVVDARSFAGYVLHIGRIQHGRFRVGDDVIVRRAQSQREAVQANHTATHLLNLALRQALGEHVDQKGSLVDPHRLRFDFANPGPMEHAQIARAEASVRERIGANLAVSASIAPLAQAQKISGLRAVFGEKYPDPVRVVAIGATVEQLLADPANQRWRDLSVEFCGGTHVATTGAIGSFALVSETGVAKGIRRVEALTGAAATEAQALARALEQRIDSAGAKHDAELGPALSETSNALDAAVISLSEKQRLRDRLASLAERAKGASKQAAAEAARLASERARTLAESLDPDGVLVAQIDVGDDRAALQAALKTIQQMRPSAAVMLVSVSAQSVSIIAGVGPEHARRGLRAGDWVREAAGVVGGKGGGRPEQAQGGGPDVAKAAQAIERARSVASAARA